MPRELCAHGLRGAFLVEDVQFGDREARGRQQFDDRPGEVAAARKTRFSSGWSRECPAPYWLIQGQPVLQEVQPPPGFEDPSHLMQRGSDIGDDPHQPPGGDAGRVIAVVLERQ